MPPRITSAVRREDLTAPRRPSASVDGSAAGRSTPRVEPASGLALEPLADEHPQHPQPRDGLDREHAVAHERRAEAQGRVAARRRPRSRWPSRTASIWSTASPSTSSSHRSELDADRSTVLSPSSGPDQRRCPSSSGSTAVAPDRSTASADGDPAAGRAPRPTTGSSAAHREGGLVAVHGEPRRHVERLEVELAGEGRGEAGRAPGSGRRRRAPAPAARAPRRSGCPSARGAGRGGRSRPSERQVEGVGDQPGAAVVGARPTGSRAWASRRRWWRRRGRRRAAQPSSGQGVGIADPQHAERLVVVLVVDEAERAGVVARRHRPAPVERGAEHGHDADDDRRGGQAGRDLPPPEPVAREVDLEGRHPHGGRQRQADGGRHEEHVDGRERRRRACRAAASQASPNDAMASVQPRTAHVWRSAARDEQRQRGGHEEAPPERRAPERAGLEPQERGEVGRLRAARTRR